MLASDALIRARGDEARERGHNLLMVSELG
jgi:hypothetical protein